MLQLCGTSSALPAYLVEDSTATPLQLLPPAQDCTKMVFPLLYCCALPNFHIDEGQGVGLPGF